MVESIHRFKKTLIKHGLSTTSARLLVFKTLEQSGPISMNELCSRLGNDIDRASVYRSIALFEKLFIAQRINIGWKYKLELSNEFQKHHHHLLCSVCDKLVDFNDLKVIEDKLDEIASKYGFSVTSHQIELQGLCNKCHKNNIDPDNNVPGSLGKSRTS